MLKKCVMNLHLFDEGGQSGDGGQGSSGNNGNGSQVNAGTTYTYQQAEEIASAVFLLKTGFPAGSSDKKAQKRYLFYMYSRIYWYFPPPQKKDFYVL